jgi:hypothetical protein
MVMILCEIGDGAALWAAGRLQERGIAVDLVTGAALGAARRWEHRIAGTDVRTAITLPDGRVLDSADARPILNRLSYIPTERLRAVAGADYGYAMQELYALYLSWLAGWPGRVINRPVPQGLCGNFRHPSEWATLAARAGLSTTPWKQGSGDAPDQAWMPRPAELVVHICGEEVVAPIALPDALQQGCRALAALAQCDLLGADFVRDGDAWHFAGATPLPDLIRGGDALADALAKAFAP